MSYALLYTKSFVVKISPNNARFNAKKHFHELIFHFKIFLFQLKKSYLSKVEEISVKMLSILSLLFLTILFKQHFSSHHENVISLDKHNTNFSIIQISVNWIFSGIIYIWDAYVTVFAYKKYHWFLSLWVIDASISHPCH